ncbi:MAG TPA: 16S rRNA (adenine(1518)-N(6)/adenine(1519)-N(6))-dimethyltransferase RsmA [Candidatus Limiplasma sp.]|nr:16S rRNA (adenine(1518)-N(6)/adenine(1519)-N(6))-dimethyltransferase RsmA [Candidatus Limiplasma sp.]HRX08423.1 16S rRNA (adenine(1518)-N(6)/adenine(1519)-N(6))-dimethyltransferase RsmA [Candidatus Limiplasma sp.]
MKRNSGAMPTYAKPAVHHKKDLGQHFLYDMELLRSLVRKANVAEGDDILEVGAGAGTLTRALCETGANVVSVEVDQALLANLQRMGEEFPNLTIIKSDIRKLDFSTLPFQGVFSVVANIPYNITSQILDLFWGKGLQVKQMSVMVQEEVADKLVANPGDKAYGLTSVRAHYYCLTEIAELVPAAAFTPPPKVDSAFVTLPFRKAPPLPVEDEAFLWRIVNASYSMRRKTMQNALKGVLPFPAATFQGILDELGLSATVRGETLSVEQWITLSNAIVAKTRSCFASPIR